MTGAASGLLGRPLLANPGWALDRLSCRRFYGGRLPAAPQQQQTAGPLVVSVAVDWVGFCLVLGLARVGLAGRWCAQRGALFCVCGPLLLLLSCCSAAASVWGSSAAQSEPPAPSYWWWLTQCL
jgi:hypothetical protein